MKATKNKNKTATFVGCIRNVNIIIIFIVYFKTVVQNCCCFFRKSKNQKKKHKKEYVAKIKAKRRPLTKCVVQPMVAAVAAPSGGAI